VTSAVGGAAEWLAPLLPSVPTITDLDAVRLRQFEEALAAQLKVHPVGPGIEPELRGRRLALIRRELARTGHLALAVPARDGGSQVRATATAAAPHRDGRWRLSGTKTWISRLEEASVFIVFFTDPAGRLSAGIVDASADGLSRHAVRPSGLAGWSWGELRLHEVPLCAQNVLRSPRSGHGAAA
jgi:alkylation response protein AidB-like acyl-CoA dehydrogenase